MRKLRLKNVLLILCVTALVQTGCGSEGAEPNQMGIQTVPLGNGTGQSNGTGGGTDNSVVQGNGVQNAGATVPETTNSIVGELVTTDSGDADREAMLAAYMSALENIYYNQIFPGGEDHGYDGINDMSINKFAIYDIDRDNREELIICYYTTITAGEVAMICDYDSASGTVRTEFSEYPSLICYDNGVIEAQWSHNQGLACNREDFWPYTLYQYNQETDSYTMVRMVDAWSKSRAEKDYDGNPFPDEKDVDGDGFLYYVMTVGEYGLNTLVDSEAYNQWRDSYVGSALELDIQYMDLTEENIHGIAGK